MRSCTIIVSLARLSHGAERESGLLPYTDPCLTPQEFLEALIGSDDVFGYLILVGRTSGPPTPRIWTSRPQTSSELINTPRNSWCVRHGSVYGSRPDCLSAPCESLASETSTIRL